MVETGKTLPQRFAQHRGYVLNKQLDKATGAHFNRPGHKMSDMKVTILEKVHSDDPQMRNTRKSLTQNTEESTDRLNYLLIAILNFLVDDLKTHN